jgi:hypothetical protein
LQSDVIDLKNIAFGSGTTASYVGTVVSGTLTVSDAQGDAANISLIGNHQNTTFSVSSDGAGGTMVVDPAATGLPLEGQFVFNNLGAVGKASVSVSEQNGGAGYVGSFTANALATTDGREAIDWQFDPGPDWVQHITQSYNMSVGAPRSGGSGSSASQSLSVTIGGPGSDTFVFKPGFGIDVIANLKSSDTIELDGFSSVSETNALQTLLTEAQSSQAQPLFHAAKSGHDTVINLGDHDSIILQNVQLANLHINNFAVHALLIG